SAIQRAGRAGRTRAGQCLRLYSQHDFEARPLHDAPEIERLDLAEMVLLLATLGNPALAWLDAPAEVALTAARELLVRLGALTAAGAPTDLGRRMLRLPLHPRLGRLLLEAEARGVPELGALIAALVSERTIFDKAAPASSGESD